MPHRIFLSHNFQDKPLVEAVAMKLAGIFGQEDVFYDSWSIKPGDGIIDQMAKGLEAPEFVFFFVSKSSLSSGMVALEWQNALYSASKGKTRIIPVKIDGSEMPSVLKQTLFIDMHTIGLEAAIAQIVSVTQGNASFTPQHEGFSNLSHTVNLNGDGSIDLVVRASHLMEPSLRFLVAVDNNESELTCVFADNYPAMSGFHSGIVTTPQGEPANGIYMSPLSGALTPSHPIRIKMNPTGGVKINYIGILHQKGENDWVPIPRDWSGTVNVTVAKPPHEKPE